MRRLWQPRAAWTMGCLALLIVWMVLGCGSDPSGPNGNGDERVPDFAALDVNSFSETHGQDVQFSVLASGKAVVLYFGRASSEQSRAQFAGLDTLVAELVDEGVVVTGAMINHEQDAAYASYLDEARASIPALQDTVTTVDGQNVPQIGYLLDALEGDELLIIDSGRYLRRSEKAGGVEGHYDLRDTADRETVMSWIRDLF